MITLEQLESHLWKAADILRGSIDSSDYKNYIFGFLFLKRTNDVFEEEAEKVLARELKRGVSEKEARKTAFEDRDEHQFFVPKKARWAGLDKAEGLGELLNIANQHLEEENPSKLEGVLAGLDYNDEHKLGDAKSRDVVLGQLYKHFNDLNLRNENLSEPDMLGRAYEYLIERFADDAGKKGGEFYTPRGVVQLMVALLDVKEGQRICDPTCGSGGMLIECAHQVKNARKLSLYGQEKNLGTWAICKMNMILHGILDMRIEKGDTIREPKLKEKGELMVFDRVIANPPFSLDKWGQDIAEKDPFGRFEYGIPPKSKGDLAFVQHMLAVTSPKGKVAVVMPHGVLFRGAAEEKIRAGFLEHDLIEAVIGLPSNLFYGTGIPAAVILFNKAKPEERRGKVLFVDASAGFDAGKRQNRLREEDIKKILKTVTDFKTVKKFSKIETVKVIQKEHENNLNISRFVDTSVELEPVNMKVELKKLKELLSERDKAEKEMFKVLKEMGFEA